ncbi:SDR family NAD(P)-dependent oxidoreductase [Nocardia abscessus]|uniref:SDR family NAD(P)-dependent oxidoreductase n=1 Tax=Nocardia abscessus TaxID=120957 RepID=UPI002455DF09|nr:SDR family NAD(P)-dependent oxidoreductase [Nocardia abscessus]
MDTVSKRPSSGGQADVLGKHVESGRRRLGRDKVAATARDTGALSDLVAAHGDAVLPLALDITDKAAVTESVRRAHEHFGRLDVVVNNAGYGLFGMVEELTGDDLRAQFETNLFGTVWVVQAALPTSVLRAVATPSTVSSLLGVASFPTTGGYAASKAAVEALLDSLAQEVAGFGVNVTVVEPGPFGTEFNSSSAYSAPLPAYDSFREAVQASFATNPSPDPAGVGPALLKVVDADTPPSRIFFGTFPLQVVPQLYADRVKGWQEWAELSAEAEAGPA